MVVTGDAPVLVADPVWGERVELRVSGSAGQRPDPALPRDRHGGPCVTNGAFAPPFLYDENISLLAFPVSAMQASLTE